MNESSLIEPSSFFAAESQAIWQKARAVLPAFILIFRSMSWDTDDPDASGFIWCSIWSGSLGWACFSRTSSSFGRPFSARYSSLKGFGLCAGDRRSLPVGGCLHARNPHRSQRRPKRATASRVRCIALLCPLLRALTSQTSSPIHHTHRLGKHQT